MATVTDSFHDNEYRVSHGISVYIGVQMDEKTAYIHINSACAGFNRTGAVLACDKSDQ